MTSHFAPLPAVAEPPSSIDWSRHALFLDFDGTLAPLRDRPEDVEMSAATASLLATALHQTAGAVAVISGRPLAELSTMTGPLDLALSGSHGAEWRFPGQSAPETASGSEALEAAFAELAPLATQHELLIERKPGAIALHFRARPDLADTCRAAVAASATGTAQRALHGNMVSEVVMNGVNKGTALRMFLERPPFQGRVPVMIGDDTTDEDGFAAAQGLGGFGLRIGGRETVARYRVPGMEDALVWLSATLTHRT